MLFFFFSFFFFKLLAVLFIPEAQRHFTLIKDSDPCANTGLKNWMCISCYAHITPLCTKLNILYILITYYNTAHFYSFLHIHATNFKRSHFMNPLLAVLVYKRFSLVRFEFSQPCCWRFRSSEMWRVNGQVFPNVSKGCSDFTFKVSGVQEEEFYFA